MEVNILYSTPEDCVGIMRFFFEMLPSPFIITGEIETVNAEVDEILQIPT